MTVGEKPYYLVLTRKDNSKSNSIRIEKNLADVVSDWSSATRCSPIFSIFDNGIKEHKGFIFKGKHLLLFTGPQTPCILSDIIPSVTNAWVTLGIFNLILLQNDSPGKKKELIKWIKQQNIAYELWTIHDGVIKRQDYFCPENVQGGKWREQLRKLTMLKIDTQLKDLISEYCPLMASAISRCSRATHSAITDLTILHDFVYHEINDYAKSKPKNNHDYPHELVSLLTNINAALSRYTSQTFSGISPIRETECHFWNHSLLGIGIASLGLRNLREFIQTKIGEVRLPERFDDYRNIPYELETLINLELKDSFWTTDHLCNTKLPSQKEPLIPLLTYFSARDGFRSTENTLSVPLTMISSCSSTQYSLLTITHEIAHSVVRGILASIYPDLESVDDLEKCLILFNSKDKKSKTVFVESQKQFIYVLARMSQKMTVKNFELDTEGLRKCLYDHYRDAEEIMVHVFDYLYFYSSDTERYVTDLWLTWSIIPNIDGRIEEYLIRTICAVCSTNLRKDDPAAISKNKVSVILKKISQQKKLHHEFIDKAVIFLDRKWKDDISIKVKIRLGLVSFVRSLIYSQKFALSLSTEEFISANNSRTEGYSQKISMFDQKPISNPLRFVRVFGQPSLPSEGRSLWLLTELAFNGKNG